jgi:hypothetical protein
MFLTALLSAGAIASGPYEYDGHTYYLTSITTWANAEAEAVAMGGHLISVNDAAEQAFINGLLSGSTWIGLTDEGTNVWAWTNGDPVSYTNWSTYEPNGGTTENCGVSEGAWGGLWNDLPCDRVHRGIVELEPADEDGDGYPAGEAPGEDCNDQDASVNPGAYEVPGNFTDENCDGDIGDCYPCFFWRNHGEYVRCVAHAVDDLLYLGVITEDEGDTIVSSGAQTEIGKKGFIPEECN